MCTKLLPAHPKTFPEKMSITRYIQDIIASMSFTSEKTNESVLYMSKLAFHHLSFEINLTTSATTDKYANPHTVYGMFVDSFADRIHNELQRIMKCEGPEGLDWTGAHALIVKTIHNATKY